MNPLQIPDYVPPQENVVKCPHCVRDCIKESLSTVKFKMHRYICFLCKYMTDYTLTYKTLKPKKQNQNHEPQQQTSPRSYQQLLMDQQEMDELEYQQYQYHQFLQQQTSQQEIHILEYQQPQYHYQSLQEQMEKLNLNINHKQHQQQQQNQHQQEQQEPRPLLSCILQQNQEYQQQQYQQRQQQLQQYQPKLKQPQPLLSLSQQQLPQYQQYHQQQQQLQRYQWPQIKLQRPQNQQHEQPQIQLQEQRRNQYHSHRQNRRTLYLLGRQKQKQQQQQLFQQQGLHSQLMTASLYDHCDTVINRQRFNLETQSIVHPDAGFRSGITKINIMDRQELELTPEFQIGLWTNTTDSLDAK